MPYFFILISIFFILNTTSCKTQKALQDSTDPMRSSLVISDINLQQSMGTTCNESMQCHPPLTCNLHSCGLPPSMTGKANAQTPQLNFVDEHGSVRSVHVEVVRTPKARELGLMFRKYIHPDWGMLFVFPSDDYRSFWMQNTFIALDMVFIRGNGSVSNVVQNAAPLRTETLYPSTDKVRYVLELGSGNAQRLGINNSTTFKDLPK